MIQNRIGTIITFNIQPNEGDNDRARKALDSLFLELGYQDGDSQHTKITPRIIPDTTIEDINYLCNDPRIRFQDGDEVAVLYPYMGKTEAEPSIIKCRYRYNSILNQFI
ncbi:MAG: hypothetical protein HDR88_09835 [Bacteroides sp.]|nr:hypothetical protein [Bacteroides sp.]